MKCNVPQVPFIHSVTSGPPSFPAPGRPGAVDRVAVAHQAPLDLRVHLAPLPTLAVLSPKKCLSFAVCTRLARVLGRFEHYFGQNSEQKRHARESATICDNNIFLASKDKISF